MATRKKSGKSSSEFDEPNVDDTNQTQVDDYDDAENAEAVINAMLSKEYGQKLTEVTNYPSTSAEVAALFRAADKRKLGFDLVDRGVKLYGLNFPANIDKWVESWNIIKTA